MARPRILAAGIATAGISAVLVFAASLSVTEAQRNASQHAATEFVVTVDPVLELEGSADGETWHDSVTATELTFTPDQMALQVGQENAVYARVQVRAAAGSNTGASANIVETGLGDSAFGGSLRGAVYRGAATCDASGVAGAESLTADTELRDQSSIDFTLPAPAARDEPGETVTLCVQVWMNDNNWLLGGTVPPAETARWTVTGTSQSG